MTDQFSRLTVPICATMLTLSGIVACSTQTTSTVENSDIATATEPTVFNCEQTDREWATYAQRAKKKSESPLITWNTTEFGAEFTPAKRCEIVSGKLTKVVAENGGRLTGLNLRTGQVDTGQTVVCVVKQPSQRCDFDNMLFTLNSQNTQNPNAVVAKITNFAQVKAAGS